MTLLLNLTFVWQQRWPSDGIPTTLLIRENLLAICLDDNLSSNPIPLAVAFKNPILVFQRSSSRQSCIEAIFDIVRVSRCEVSWFLKHLVNALRFLKDGDHACRISSVSIIDVVERALFGEHLPSQSLEYRKFALPSGISMLHDTLLHWVKAEPLSIVVRLSSLGDNVQISYISFFTIALTLANHLRKMDIAADTIIPIFLDDPISIALSALAVSISGAAYMMLAPDAPSCQLLRECTKSQTRIALVALAKDDLKFRLCELGFVVLDPSVMVDSSVWNSPFALHRLSAPDNHAPAMITNSAPSQLAHTAISSPDLCTSGFLGTSHAEACAIIQDKATGSFINSSSVIALVPCTESYILSQLIWHIFTRGATLSVPAHVDDCLFISSLIALESTHLVVPLEQLDAVESLILAATSDYDDLDQREHGKLPRLHTIILSSRPSISWSPDPLQQRGMTILMCNEYGNLRPLDYIEDVITGNEVTQPEVLFTNKGAAVMDPRAVLDMIPAGNSLNDIGTRVVKITDNLVVKYGSCVRSVEAHHMHLVHDLTDIPIPQVYLAFKFESCTYIVMDYVDGVNLQVAWDGLDDASRDSVVGQLMTHLRKLRSLKCPNGVPGPVDGSVCCGRWFTFYNAGPFQTYPALVAWLNRKLDVSMRGKASSIARFSTHHPLVFTHQDISPRNLIIDKSGKLWIIDWQLSGWYPGYFEYACTMSDIGDPEHPVPDSWKRRMHSSMDVYEDEHSALQAIMWVLETMPFA